MTRLGRSVDLPCALRQACHRFFIARPAANRVRVRATFRVRVKKDSVTAHFRVQGLGQIGLRMGEYIGRKKEE